jgi:hypothetical protein
MHVSKKENSIRVTDFWDSMPCNVVNIYQCFGGICCLNLQDRTVLLFSSQRTIIFTAERSPNLTLIYCDMTPEGRKSEPVKISIAR